MALETTVTLSVQWLNPDTGLGRVVESVALTVEYMDGTEVVIAPEAITVVTAEATGATYVYVLSTLGLPGWYVTATWTGTLSSLPLPEKVQRVTYLTLSPRTANKTLIKWQPYPNIAALHYKVEAALDGEVIYTVGYPTSTTVLDLTEFDTEVDARRIRYYISAAEQIPQLAENETDMRYYRIPDCDIVTKRTDHEMCFLSDVVDLPSGFSPREHTILFNTARKDLPRATGGANMAYGAEVVTVSPFGVFGVYLIQGALVEVTSSSLGLRGRFAVPLTTTAKLSDLTTMVQRASVSSAE